MYIPQVARGLSAQPPTQHTQTLSSLFNDSSLIPAVTSPVHITIVNTSAIILTFQSLAFSLRTFKNSKWCSCLLSVFGADLRTESDLCFIHHKLIGFYNRGGKCLQRGTD
jgi:hypothetical protein